MCAVFRDRKRCCLSISLTQGEPMNSDNYKAILKKLRLAIAKLLSKGIVYTKPFNFKIKSKSNETAKKHLSTLEVSYFAVWFWVQFVTVVKTKGG